MAPFAPFTAEDIWQKLKIDSELESVHLESWPTSVTRFNFFRVSRSKIFPEMKTVRNIITLGLEARQNEGIKVRQPLAVLKVKDKIYQVNTLN